MNSNAPVLNNNVTSHCDFTSGHWQFLHVPYIWWMLQQGDLNGTFLLFRVIFLKWELAFLFLFSNILQFPISHLNEIESTVAEFIQFCQTDKLLFGLKVLRSVLLLTLTDL